MARPYVKLVVGVLLLVPPHVLGGQSVRHAPTPSEAALAAGRLDELEASLYEASRRAPRDPAARTALGAYLAARGQLRIGAVLLEEARQFDGDARAIDERLLHICAWTGVYDLGVAVPGAAHVSAPQRAQLLYLSQNPQRLASPESVVVRLEPHETAGLGRVDIDVGGVRLAADIDPTIEGVVLPSSAEVLQGVRAFGSEETETFAVAHALAIGAMRLQNVAVRLLPEATARIGLDVIGRLRPTFAPLVRTLTLHANPVATARGGVAAPARGAAAGGSPASDGGAEPGDMPVLLGFPGIRIVTRAGSPPVALESAAGRAALRGTRWTLDLRRGVVSIAR